MIKLFLQKETGGTDFFDVASQTATVGRSSQNDIRINDPSVSRRHLRIRKKAGKYFVVDLNSTNGTYVKNVCLRPGDPVEIEEGVPIFIGQIRVSLGNAESSDTQEKKVPPTGAQEKKGKSKSEDRPMTPQKNMELLFKVANVLMQSYRLNTAFETILNHIFDLLKRIDRGVFVLIDDETQEFQKVIIRFKKGTRENDGMYSRTIVERVIQEGRPVMMQDTAREPKENLSESMEIMNVKSVMCVPLISNSKIRGAIYVDSVNDPNGFRKDDLSLLTALSSPAAMAIENASLHYDLRKLAAAQRARASSVEKTP